MWRPEWFYRDLAASARLLAQPGSWPNAVDKLRRQLASFVPQSDRASALPSFNPGADKCNSRRKIMNDELSRNTKHPITEAREIPITPGIRSALSSMDATIHFHDQPERRSDEVRDVPVPKNDLPAKRDTEPITPELLPERALRFLSEEPHVPSASSEDVLAS